MTDLSSRINPEDAARFQAPSEEPSHPADQMIPEDDDLNNRLPGYPLDADFDHRIGRAFAHYTMRADEFANRNSLFQNGLYAGKYRPIDRATTNFEGVVDHRSREFGVEAAFIDSKAAPDGYKYTAHLFKEKVNQAKEAMTHGEGDLSEKVALGLVFATIKETIAYDHGKPFVTKVAEQLKNSDPKYRLIQLSTYMQQKPGQKGRGVCRHMAQACAWLGSEGAKRGVVPLNGSFNVPANSIDEVGGHAWARYNATESDDVYILDVAQNFFGTLDDAYDKYMAAKSKGEKSKIWDYFVEGSGEIEFYHKRYLARQAAKVAVKGEHAGQGQNRKSPNASDYFKDPRRHGPDRLVFRDASFTDALNSINYNIHQDDALPRGGQTGIDMNRVTPLVSLESAREFFNVRGDIIASLMLGKEQVFVVRESAFRDTGTVASRPPVFMTPRDGEHVQEPVGPNHAVSIIGIDELKQGWELAHGGAPSEVDTSYAAYDVNAWLPLGRDMRKSGIAPGGGPLGLQHNAGVSRHHANIRVSTVNGTQMLFIQDNNSSNGTRVLTGAPLQPQRRSR